MDHQLFCLGKYDSSPRASSELEGELLVLSWMQRESNQVIKEIYDLYWKTASTVHVLLLAQGRIIYKYKGLSASTP